MQPFSIAIRTVHHKPFFVVPGGEYKAVLLDLMDTIMPDPFFRNIPPLAGSIKRFMRVKNGPMFLRFESGEISEEQYLANLFLSEAAAARAGFTPAEFKRAITSSGGDIHPEIRSLLADLRGRLPVYLASNYSVWVHDHLEREGLHDFLADIFVSYQLGVRKPDPGFFQAIISRLGHRPEQMIFVDDREANIKTAKELGFRAIQATDHGWADEVRRLLAL